MKQKNMLSIFLSTLALIALSACGGGGGDDSSSKTPAVATVTGQFIDAPVQGLGYSCSSGKSGVTNSNGEYACNSGDDVTFKINNIIIGKVAAQASPITPYSLFPNNTAAAINLARLLQSLDSGSNDGSIVINTALEVNIPTDVDFAATDFEARLETALSIQLISAQEAEAKMNEAIVAVGGAVPEPTPTPVEPEPTPTPVEPTPTPTPTPVEPEPTEPIENNGLATPPTPPTL